MAVVLEEDEDVVKGANRPIKGDDQGQVEGGSIHGEGKSGQVDATQSSAMPIAQGGVDSSRSHDVDGGGLWGRTDGDRALGGEGRRRKSEAVMVCR